MSWFPEKLQDPAHPIWGIVRPLTRIAGMGLILWLNGIFGYEITQQDVSSLMMYALLDGSVEFAQVKAMKKANGK